MSHTLTISDILYSKLQTAARQRGLANVEKLLESWPTTELDPSRFQTLVSQWKAETSHMSNVGKKALHPAYQEIIGMGKDAIPLILAELRNAPDDWFWALHAITGANPVPDESRGELDAMSAAWIKWGREHGFDV